MTYAERKTLLLERQVKLRKGGMDRIEVLLDELIERCEETQEDGPDDGTIARVEISKLASIVKELLKALP